mmetsp:Transcript_4209/g.10926  ORF Transcript_4209/g.10926 Transcript_4209/m.10926 type:complete len:206 (-) Transcript_4209:117-734(-)
MSPLASSLQHWICPGARSPAILLTHTQTHRSVTGIQEHRAGMPSWPTQHTIQSRRATRQLRSGWHWLASMARDGRGSSRAASSLLGAEGLVASGIHELVQLARVGELDLRHPAVCLRRRVDQRRLVVERLVDLHDLTRHRRVDVARSLDRLDRAHRVILLDARAHLGQIDEDNVAQLLLRVVGDANGADVALNLDPLVVLAELGD